VDEFFENWWREAPSTKSGLSVKLKAHLAFECGCGENWKLYLYLTYPYHQTLKGKNHVLQLQISQRQDEDPSLVYWNNDLSFNNKVCSWTCLFSSTPLR
jgi:hypothetical protein